MPHPHWPLFDLRLRTPRLELRVPTDDDLVALADLAAAGVHPPEEMPFLFPWTRAPSPDLERGLLQWGWRHRAGLSTQSWTLNFAVFLEGTAVGVQGVSANDFAVRRTVKTGSWVGLAHQGQGVGTEMRAAVLHLAFAGLGADHAETGAFEWNIASQRVTEAHGYQPDGVEVVGVEGKAIRELRYRLTRERWEQHRRTEVAVEHLEPCLPMLVAS